VESKKIIQEIVFSDCNKVENVFTPLYYNEHIMAVTKYSLEIAEYYQADREVVEIAAYLHDISAIRDISTVKTHATDSGIIAEEILKDLKYPEDFINKVVACINNHSTPIKATNGNIESMCLSNADVLSKLMNPAYWFFYVYSIKKFEYNKGIEWLKKEIINKWSMLDDYARQIGNEKYYNFENLFFF
jgi:uncharacterized protein